MTNTYTDISLVAIATDPDGDSLDYHWEAVGGTLSGGFSRRATWGADEVGSYDIRVTVEDDHGLTDRDTITVVVSGEN